MYGYVVCGVHVSTSYAMLSLHAVSVSDIHTSVQLELKVEGFFDWTVTVIFWYFCVFLCIIGIVSYSSHVISGSLYQGMVRPLVTGGGTASNMEGSCEYIE